jgi:hypothetical protein
MPNIIRRLWLDLASETKPAHKLNDNTNRYKGIAMV